MEIVKTGELISDDVSCVNQILPHTNKWAWDLYLIGKATTWAPTEVAMAKDIEQWKGKALSDDEKLVIKRCLGFFAGSESLVSNNLFLNIFKFITDAECRQYIAEQQGQENLHNWTVVYVCDSLNLDYNEIYNAHNSIPAIKEKDDFLMKVTKDLGRNTFTTTTLEGKQELLRNIITYYVICEGIFFYSGFAMLLSFGRQNKMSGICEQIQYTLRDEENHLRFGVQLINKIKEQYPDVWTTQFQDETIAHIQKAVELEIAYAKDVLPRGILGLNSTMFVEYMKFIANKRLDAIGLQFQYKDAKNPFPWLSEVIDIGKMKNFFESRVTEYQTGNIKDDF